MHIDPHFLEFSLVFLLLFIVGFLCRLIKLPAPVGFLISGMVLGPNFLAIVKKSSAVSQIGSAGVVLLMFFIGLELSPKDLFKEWKINIVGTLLQILGSVFCIFLVGTYLDWPMTRIVLLGFVISLSSTSMVIQLLNDKKLTHTQTGKDTIGILISQDIYIVPMLIVLGLISNAKLDILEVSKQFFGGSFLLFLYLYSPQIHKFKFPLIEKIMKDKELSFLFCIAFSFGMASLSALFELSTALGAFIAGGIVGQLNLNKIFNESLGSIRVILTALFFASLGVLLDVNFLKENTGTVLELTALALVTNTVINALILKAMGRSWKESFRTSSYLAQIGEFSFMLAAIGLQESIITQFAYQVTIFIIFISIIVTPIWVKLIGRLLGDTQPN